MNNNDGIYYKQAVANISRLINFISYLWNKLNRKHGFHPTFIDEHLRVLDEMKMNVKYLLHVHMREAGRKTRRDWLESVKYRDHYPVDLNWCSFCGRSRCVLEEAI